MLSKKLPKLSRRLEGDLEKEYRLQFLPQDIRQSRMFVLLIALGTGLFIYDDLSLLIGNPLQIYVFTFRLLYMALGVTLFVYLLIFKRSYLYDLFLFIFTLLGTALYLFTGFIAPVDSIGPMMLISVLVIMVLYLAFPINMVYRAIPALIFTAGNIVMILTQQKLLPLPLLIAPILILLVVNMICIIATYYFYSLRRKQFITNRELVRQIGERDRLSRELTESQANLSAIFESTDDLIWSVDPVRFGLITYNKAFYKDFKAKNGVDVRPGMTPEDIAPQNISDTWKKYFQRALQEGPYQIEHELADKTDTLGLSFQLMKSGDKTFGISVFGKNITQQKKINTALQESERKFRDLAELLPQVVFETDIQGNVLFLNKSSFDIFGYRDIQKEKINVLHFIAPEDKARAAANVQKLLAGECIGPNEYTAVKSDGSRIPIIVSSNVVKNNLGAVVGLRGVLVDITVRKKYEEQIRLDEARLESLLRINQYPEESIQKLLDFALEEAIQLTHSEIGYIYFYHEKREEFELNTWSREVLDECTVANPQTIYQLEKTGIWGEAVRQRKPIIVNDFAAPDPLKKGLPPGHTALHKFMTIPVFEGEKIVAVVGVANKAADYDPADVRQLTLLMSSVWKIVEKRQATEELRTTLAKLQELYTREKAQRQELEEESKARAMFINILGHELRTPLTPLLASSGILQEILSMQDSGIEKRLIDNIQSSAMSLNKRLEELLDLARLSRGTFTIQRYPLDLAELIRQVTARYQVMVEKEQKALRVEVSDGLPKQIEADPNRLEQVLTNLLSNAIKYSPVNTTITLRVYYTEPNIFIEVQDQGIGISPEEQKKLFKPYHRVEQDRLGYPGIGLGLAICKQIVEAHGGRIKIKSELGQGATFIVLLPNKGQLQRTIGS
jgi:two-component system, OmpR family, phosphate regulon sensor histidine kinase PhoR